MAATPYSLRSRLNGQSPSLRTPMASPAAKPGARSPRKQTSSAVNLQLQQVIGTTTNSPTGLACCASSNSYAYCAGAIAVLAAIHADGSTTRRYFKARPNASSLNPSSSYYDTSSPSSTPSRRRTSIFARRKTRDADVASGRDWQDEGGSQTWTARERIKTVTCVSLSENGRWMAVGESGYNPRVLLYSTSEDALLDTPVSIVSDHAVGLKCVAFSPDSRYLATLGNLNDGFLFIWAIHPKTGALSLHSANKCTTNIFGMTWCGQFLITFGTRHVKIWNCGQPTKSTPSKRFKLRSIGEEVASPGPTTLSGRNALLGPLVDSTFTSAAAVDNRTLFLGTDSGHLCAIEVSGGSPELRVSKVYDFGITSVAWEPSFRRLLLGGRHGIFHEDYTSFEPMLQTTGACDQSRPKSPRKGNRSSSIRRSLGLLQPETAAVSVLSCLSQHTIALDSDGNLHLTPSSKDDSQPQLSYACHNDLILGVQKLPDQCDLGTFYTWSRRGEVRFWDTGGTLVNSKLICLDQQDIGDDEDQNELRVVRFVSGLRQFVLGDRFGVIKLIDGVEWSSSWTGRAHGGEISDITVHEFHGFVATCGRDRMVQLFQVNKTNLDLIQTLEDHIGAVTQVMFTTNADKLLSCSADRTVVVRERALRGAQEAGMTAYLSARVITLRSTPLSMTFFDSTCTALVVSTSDRHIVKVDSSTGALIESCKITDPENDDTVCLNSLCISQKRDASDNMGNLLAAYSSTDKSVRIYSADTSLLLTRESGHTEGISDLCLIENCVPDSDRIERILVSTGLDGTIIIWSIAFSSPVLFSPAQEMPEAQAMQGYDSDGTPVKPSPVSLPPLRRVLTKMDMIELAKSPAATSPSSPRSLSPPRLTRKRSQLALTTTIDEKEEEPQASIQEPPRVSQTRIAPEVERSPSPPPAALSKLRKQRSRPEISSEARKGLGRRSPSPPAMPSSTPTTPKHRTVANNSRLRRPPSVPTDLRGHALAQSRRQSMSQASDFGSMGMATEQACRMLRTYRRKLMANKEELGLDELADELEMITKLVKERKEKASRVQPANADGRRMKVKAATENDADELAVLLERTNLADRSPRQGVEVQS